MKNSLVLVLAMVALLVGAATGGTYSGGSGEPNNPYQISSVADWQELMATPTDWGGQFVLTADIDLNDVPITPVGNDANNFTGVFDGNDRIICNADVNMPGADFVGLFGWLGMDGQIKNLAVENIYVFGGYYVGGLVGYNYYGGMITNCYSSGSALGKSYVGGLVGGGSRGTITGCYSMGSVLGSGWFVGGLVGQNCDVTISNCYSTGSVTGDVYVGGLVGDNYYGTIINSYSTGSVTGNNCVGGLVGSNEGNISNCYSTGSVSGTDYYVGGLVGFNYGAISDCYSTGSVSDSSSLGGLVGRNYYGTVTNSYSTGSVSGTSYVGGLVGDNSGAISNCYSSNSVSGTGDYVGGLVGSGDPNLVTTSFWDKDTSGWTTSAGGEGKTTAEMNTMNTFTNSGWDFVEIWGIGENQTYPFLRFAPAGDLNYDKKVDLLDFAILASHWLEGPP